MWTELSNWATVGSAVVTAIGVLVAAWQIRLSQQQGVTTFEDSVNGEYRLLAAQLPTKALLGEDLTEAEHDEHLDEFYHYFDLCNGQIFHRQQGRISKKTWAFWDDGIRANLKRPAFRKSWENISNRANGDFDELRRLLGNEPGSDPRSWRTKPARPPKSR